MLLFIKDIIMKNDYKTYFLNWILRVCVLFSLFPQGVCIASLAVSSTSSIVGAQAIYLLNVTGLNATVGNGSMQIQFQPWSSTLNSPFASNAITITQNSSAISICILSFGTLLTCPISNATSTMNFALNNLFNPSSTKPYPISVTFSWLSNFTLTATLIATALPSTFFSLTNYVNNPFTSSVVLFYLSFDNYFDPNTKLKLNYDANFLSLTGSSTANYTQVVNVLGSTTISNWQSTTSNQLISAIKIVNPGASLSLNISGLLYFTDFSNKTYNISTFWSTLNIATMPFTTLTTNDSLTMLTSSSLRVISSCPVTSGNTTATKSNTIFTLVQSQAAFTSPECNPTMCSFQSNTLVSFKIIPAVLSSNQIDIFTLAYTFFNNQLYPLCAQNLSTSLLPQLMSLQTNLNSCSNSTLAFNNISFRTNVNSYQLSDTINASISAGTIVSISVLNNNATSITISFAYKNPSSAFTPVLTALTLSRFFVVYASLSSNISVCQVTNGQQISSYSLSISNTQTYSFTQVFFPVTLNMNDYAVGDTITIRVLHNAVDNVWALTQLSNFNINNQVSPTTIVNISTFIVSLSANSLATISNRLLGITFLIRNAVQVGNLSFQLDTFSNGLIKQSLHTTSISLTPSSLSFSLSQISMQKSNNITLTIINAKRAFLLAKSNTALSLLTIFLPFSCDNVINETVNVNWFSIVNTSSLMANGNGTYLDITLINCFVAYGQFVVNVSETITKVASTSTKIPVTNYCGQCLTCLTPSWCTRCFNSSNTNLTLLFEGVCYSVCPSRTFAASNFTCVPCLVSCSACSNHQQCTQCFLGSTLIQSNGSCLSNCGAGLYYMANACAKCHINCFACLNASYCYICQPGAQISYANLSTSNTPTALCTFTTCTFPCASCQGFATFCLSCVSPYGLFGNQCLSACPTNSFFNEGLCIAVATPIVYIPVTLTGLACFLAILLLRFFAAKRMFKKAFTTLPYKLNVIRLTAAVFAVLQLPVALISLQSYFTYGLKTGIEICVPFAFVLQYIFNIVFLLKYCFFLGNQVSNTVSVSKTHPYQSICILVFSTLTNFRLHKIIYSNIFRMNNDPLYLSKYINKDSLEQKKLKKEQTFDSKTGEVVTGSIKISNIKNEILNKNDQQIGEDSRMRRISHPFGTYLSLAQMCSGTVLYLIGCVLNLSQSKFVAMQVWSIDGIMVLSISLLLSGYDNWSFANLSVSEQHSEISLEEEVKAGVGQRKDPLSPMKKSPLKFRPATKPKMEAQEYVRSKVNGKSNRHQHLPTMKVFDDLEGEEEQVEPVIMRRPKIIRAGKEFKVQDIYLNFDHEEIILQRQDTRINFLSDPPSQAIFQLQQLQDTPFPPLSNIRSQPLPNPIPSQSNANIPFTNIFIS